MTLLYAFLPRYVNHNSNGITVYGQILQSLCRTLDAKIKLISYSSYPETLKFYKQNYKSRLIHFDDSNKDNALSYLLGQENFFILRPDDVNHTPLIELFVRSSKLRGILNLLLAPPFSFADRIWNQSRKSLFHLYGSKDYFIFYNKNIQPALANLSYESIYIEPQLPPLLTANINLEKRGKRISLYLGKGKPCNLGHATSILSRIGFNTHSCNFTLIGRSFPSKQEELYRIIASSSILISFDPFSHIERVSGVLGTPVLKIYQYNLKEIPAVTTNAAELVENLVKPNFNLNLALSSYSDYLARVQSNASRLEMLSSAISSFICNGLRDPNIIVASSRSLINHFIAQSATLKQIICPVPLMTLQENLQIADVLEIAWGDEYVRNPRSLTTGSWKLSYLDSLASFPYNEFDVGTAPRQLSADKAIGVSPEFGEQI